jgi:tetratricopeptide (TPR) repeat protein
MSRRKASNSKSASRHALPASPGRAWSKRRIGLITAAVLLAVATCGGWNALCRGMASRAMATRDYEAAERWLSAAVLWGGHAETCLQQARLARKLSALPTAVDWVARSASAGLDELRVEQQRWLIAAQSGQLRDVEFALRRWLPQVEPEDSVDLCEAYANGLFMSGRTQEALLIIDTWRQDAPSDPLPLLMKGRSEEAHRRAEQAEAAYLAVLDVTPGQPHAEYAMGRLRFHQNQPEPALAHYSSAAAGFTANAAPRLGMARCLMQLGRTDEAAVQLEPLAELSAAEVRRAFALVQDPDPCRPIDRVRGECLVALGDYQSAIRHLTRALEVDPKEPTLRYQLAQAWRSTGRIEDAKLLLEEISADRAAIQEADRLVDTVAQNFSAPQIDIRFQLAELFFLHDSKRRAEYWYKTILNHDPRHAATHARLAECYDLWGLDDPEYRMVADHHRRLAVASRS